MPSHGNHNGGGAAGWEQLPSALRMAAMSGRVDPKYTAERRVADEALPSALHERVTERNAMPKYSWDRQESPRQGSKGTASTLREEAEAMRRRLAQLDVGDDVGDRHHRSAPTAADIAGIPAAAGKSGSRPGQEAAHQQQHSHDTLSKKLQKVEKLLEKEAPGTKEHKKLLKKRVEYQNQLCELEDSTRKGGNGTSYDSGGHGSTTTAAASAEHQARKEQMRLEARRMREEAEREAAEQLGMRHQEREDAQSEMEEEERLRERHRRRLEEEAAAAAEEEERERRRKEAIREEARRLKQEAIEKKQREEEAEEEAGRLRKEAIREEARRLKQEATEKKRREVERAEEEERTRREERIEEARRLKKEAAEKRRQEESAVEVVAAPRSTYETDDQKRKLAFLEEARRLKQDAMERKRKEEEALESTKSSYESDDQKRKEVFLEEARRLKADAMAKKEVEEAEQRAQDEVEEERKEKLRQIQLEREQRGREELLEARRLEQEELERQQARAQREVQNEKPPNGPQQEASQDFLVRRALTEPFSDNTKKILRELENMERRQKKLEKSLTQNGIPIIEEIPYEVAKDKISEITDSMKELASADIDPYQMEKKYFLLEEQLAKYTTALMLTDEYAEEQKRLEMEWEEKIEADNVDAIRRLRSHMPIMIRSMTEDELATTPTPNGKTLEKTLARKFKRTNVLQLIRVNPDDIEKMHPSLLEGMRTTGLTLTERRAIHEHLRDVGDRWQERQSDPSAEKKFQWFQGLKGKFKECLGAYNSHVEQYGPPGNHLYAKRNDPSGGGCPMIGNQCPLKSDAATDYSEDYGFTQEADYEVSDAQRSGAGGSITSSRRSTASMSKITTKSTVSDDELMDQLRELLRLDQYESDVDKKLLRELFHADKRTKSLEKQLAQNGLALTEEDIPYSVAKARVAELTQEISLVAASMGQTSDAKEIARLESEFGVLSKEMDKFNNALMLTKEWASEQQDKERQWEISISPRNFEALQKIWRHMPVDIRDMSETHLTSDPTPNGQLIPTAMAKKFKRTNILMLLRMNPTSIEPMHPSSLESMRTTGLTLTERRALHEHLKNVAPKWKSMSKDKMSERKWMWHESLKSKLKEELMKYDKHAEQYGPPGNHPYANRNDPSAGGCPLLGNQCPVKADLATDYTGDLGFPDHAEYGTQSVAKSNLLSMEDIERRRREDEMEYGGYGSAPSGTPSDDAGAAAGAPARPAGPPGGMGGILAAIKKAPTSTEDDAPKPRPPAGGILAALTGRKKK